MIKINYENAWKEFKENWAVNIKEFSNIMDNLEKKHTYDVIELKKRSDEEMLDYYMKKYTELYLEKINLENELKEYKEKPYFNVFIKGIYQNNGQEVIIQDMMNKKELMYYDNAFKKREIIKYNCRDMIIETLTISYP